MKKILITGANSYIGTSFEKWVKQYGDIYSVDTVDTISEEWKKVDFSLYDVVFHVAGIAHVKETKENHHLYYEVNCDLACDLARKAKDSGVKQFIFLSSMSVYGIESGVITKSTKTNPKSNYGKSKLLAEEYINTLGDNSFKVAILRPPMVYGNGCKGNYPRLVKLILKLPFFPNTDNVRSMIYIDNLSEFVRLLIDKCQEGIFSPQNKEYVKISDMVKFISTIHGRNIFLTKIFNPVITLLQNRVSLVNKVFGSLVYDQDMSEYKQPYCVIDFKKSIKLTEEKIKK